MRPGKLRLVVLMQLIGVFSRPNVSAGPPRHAAQLGVADLRAGVQEDLFAATCPPIFSVFSPRATSRRGRHDERVDLHRPCPCRIPAAARKSVSLPPVQLPM